MAQATSIVPHFKKEAAYKLFKKLLKLATSKCVPLCKGISKSIESLVVNQNNQSKSNAPYKYPGDDYNKSRRK